MAAAEKLESDSYQRRVLSMHVSDSGQRHYRELHLECGHVRLQTAFKLVTRPEYALCPQCRSENAPAIRKKPTEQERLIAHYYRTGGPLMAAVRAVMESE